MDFLTVLLSLPAAVSDFLASGIPWFPQEYAEEFYIAKGMLGLLATLLVLVHMSTAWAEAMTLGRRLRYFALLYASILLAGSSAEQVSDAALVSYRNLGGMGLSVVIIVAMVVSIVESHRDR